jgi:DNA-binding MarR family transcriptional regulator
MRLEEEIKTSKFQSETHKAYLNILFTASWLRAKVASRLKPYGLTTEQFNVMRIVRGQRPKSVCVKDITHRMLERNSNTTRIIDRLEQKGLLQRLASERDRRERAIELTPEGLDLLAAIDRDWEKNNPHSSSLLLDEARELNDLLDKLRDKP